MKIIIATGNHDKFSEIRNVLNSHGITVVHRPMNIKEGDFETLEQTAIAKAKRAFEIAKEPVLVDDTGIFFSAYKNFPGVKAKRVFTHVGFSGLMEALQGKDRSAYFKTVLCYAEKRDEYELFEGIMKGRIDTKIHPGSREKLPYERIFIPEGFQKAVSEMAGKEKEAISHRAMAAKKFTKFFCEKHGKQFIEFF